MGIISESLASGIKNDDLFATPIPPPSKRALEQVEKTSKKKSKKTAETTAASDETAAEPSAEVEEESAVEPSKKKSKNDEGKIVGLEESDAEDKEDDSDASDDEDEKPEGYMSRRDRKKEKLAKDERTIFIGNLHVDMSNKNGIKELKTIFGQYGKLESIRFRSIARSDKNSRKVAFIRKEFHPLRDTLHCYIVYKEKEAVEKALTENGRIILGKHIRVDCAVKPEINYKKSVFVGNLPFDINDEALYGFFTDCGSEGNSVVGVRIIRDKGTNLGKGFGYVSFKSLEAVEDAMLKHDQELLGRKVRITRCKKSLSSKEKVVVNGKTISAPVKRGPKNGPKTGPASREGEHSRPGDVLQLNKMVKKDKKKLGLKTKASKKSKK